VPREADVIKAKKKRLVAAWGGFDLSTTGLALGVRSRGGQEAYAHTKMRGATKWKGQPAFQLAETPGMILELLDHLTSEGWELDNTAFSFAVRQHDMVLLDDAGQLLMPALSWQCNAAVSEVKLLRAKGAEETVGRIEERFILPKLMWALRIDSRLKRAVKRVMTTGDWIAWMLTGKASLSTSDAISNGLLDQRTKKLAADVMRQAKLDPDWFPKVIPSGRAIGKVKRPAATDSDAQWSQVKERLAGSPIISCLGDNHATGVGCGLEENDFQTIVISAGTSGTINRVCRPNVELAGNAACFEYYRNRLLLMMLADCCKWYDRFVAQYLPQYSDHLEKLNAEVVSADLSRLKRVLHVGGKETYPPGWDELSAGEMAASTQFSIMLELLLLVRSMLQETTSKVPVVEEFVLTGGLSQSPFFQQVFQVGGNILLPQAKMKISARQGPLRYQTAAYGALLNAMRPDKPDAAKKLCPTRAAARADSNTKRQLEYLLRAYGL
jgi:sugar (pentulose or hexulose) kinase